MQSSIKAICLSLITVSFLSSFHSAPNSKSLINPTFIVCDSPKSVEEEILLFVNKYRASKSLAPLQMNAVISDLAEKHSEEMADKKTAFGHDGFEERVRNMVQKLGALHASAENVAFGQLTPEEVVGLWLKSPGHRKNIEGNYTMTGIGVAKAKDGSLYFTQIFSIK